MENKATKVELSQEETKVLEEAKVKVEEAKAKVAKNNKNVKEKEVIVLGMSVAEAQAINTVMHHIESTKSVPKAQQQNALKQLEQIEVDLDLFKHIESELSAFNNTSKTYRDVVKKIEQLEDFRTRIERFIEMHQKSIDYTDEAISKVKSHIHEVEYENKVEVTYDEAYLRPMLDLAYVIFDIVKTEDGGVELKSKVKE
jgi:hypothetical protein